MEEGLSMSGLTVSELRKRICDRPGKQVHGKASRGGIDVFVDYLAAKEMDVTNDRVPELFLCRPAARSEPGAGETKKEGPWAVGEVAQGVPALLHDQRRHPHPAQGLADAAHAPRGQDEGARWIPPHDV
jgi:hypothetical protein